MILLTAIPLVVSLVKLEVAWAQCSGHATTDARRKFGRFPIVGICFLCLLVLLSIGGMACSVALYRTHVSLASVASIFSFFFNIVVGVAISALRWHFILYFRYWAGLEIDLRRELAHKEGVSPEDMEKILKYCRAEGFVVTDTPVPKEAMS